MGGGERGMAMRTIKHMCEMDREESREGMFFKV